jgi:hypothetical protein
MPIWKNGKPTGKNKTHKAIVNKTMIASITEYKGTCLHEGWNCSKIVINEGATTSIYYDERLPNILLLFIKNM